MERGGVRTFTPWLILDPQIGRTLGFCTNGGLRGRFPCFAPISYHSPQKSSNIHAIYQLDPGTGGKLAEGSDKLAPRIGFWAQDLDKKHFLRLGSLRERKFQGNEWKSLLHLFY